MHITRISALPLILLFALVSSTWTEVAMAQDRRINFRQQKKRVTPQIELERARFTFLTLQNPNYFGNLKTSVLVPITTIIGNTKYEEIDCVGFNPDFDRLEAVVLIKKSSGYGGGVCSNGSREYVRFYLSYDGGSTWRDQGITSFLAYNIPGDKPLEYAATLRISPSKRFCTSENLPRVRAILSWKNPPPAEEPDWLPVWGQVKEARIQIGARKLFFTADLFKELEISLPPQFQNLFDLKQELSVLEAVPLNGIELQELYKDKPVQPRRYLYKDVHELILEPKSYKTPLLLPKSIEYLQQLEVDWAQLIDDFQLVDGRTKYEELKCVGLNTNLDTLVGILTVKLPTGYSGNLCSAGSTEYVAFWVDWGGGWEHAGTGAVRIHDLTTIPDEGLQFAVHVPIDVATHRRRCQNGPTTARVRAILSWQTEPPSNNPNYVPTWGNRKQTLIHIPSGDLLPENLPAPEFYTVGGMSPNDISTPSGLANGPAVTAGFTAIDSPFGARIFLAGKIHNAPNLSASAPPLDYRVSVRQLPAGSWTPLNDDLKLKLIPWPGGIGAEYTVIQSAPDGWYEYLADHEGPVTNDINGDILAVWDTGSRTGKWQVKIDARNSANMVFPGSQLITVRLDNQAPSAAIAITSGGGDCADFIIDDVIQGTYSATDEHFNFLRLSVAPWLGGSGFIAPLPATAALPQMPLTRSYPIVPASGESGIWQLDTTGMPRCGYVTYLHVRDRTIVNSGHIGRHTSVPVGLCLREE